MDTPHTHTHGGGVRERQADRQTHVTIMKKLNLWGHRTGEWK